MTDKEFDKQKKRVRKYIDKWFKTLGLGWYWVDMHWHQSRDEKNPDTAARTTTRWQYRASDIDWYLPAIENCDDEHLEDIVVHEFVHILINPLVSVDEEADLNLHHEFATECISRAIQWAREAGQKDAKI